ncbi:MAG: BlaI/MecI/CopY family transcriptional regulator [Rhodoluna sp.]|nr:BlaI/MecI/CopY family transcriptional regulator [Rhodoluna sp.]
MAGKRSRSQGQLEGQVLDALWDAGGEVTSQQLLDVLGGGIALTTLLTVLSRLVEKELITRRSGEGRSLLFKAAVSREKHAAEQLLKIIGSTENPALAFAHFAKGLDTKALQALRDSLG